MLVTVNLLVKLWTFESIRWNSVRAFPSELAFFNGDEMNLFCVYVLHPKEAATTNRDWNACLVWSLKPISTPAVGDVIFPKSEKILVCNMVNLPSLIHYLFP